MHPIATATLLQGPQQRRVCVLRLVALQDQAAPDDYAAMEQMLTRRLTHYREAAETGKKDGFEMLPDLWLIDGGAGQVAVAKDKIVVMLLF